MRKEYELNSTQQKSAIAELSSRISDLRAEIVANETDRVDHKQGKEEREVKTERGR
jgi:uncharacterized small protein (DUF1192 family)